LTRKCRAVLENLEAFQTGMEEFRVWFIRFERDLGGSLEALRDGLGN